MMIGTEFKKKAISSIGCMNKVTFTVPKLNWTNTYEANFGTKKYQNSNTNNIIIC